MDKRARIERELRALVETMGEKNTLRDACEYALLNGGKRLRPILVLMIAEALGNKDVMPAALSVECFHTASLIADDLPCMDDDDERRDKPSVHKVFGESVAILASYTLIAEGYGGIFKNGSKDPKIALLCLEAVTRCAGIKGATNGQFLDLNPPDQTLITIQKIMTQKTSTLFEIAFVFGWLFGGGSSEKLEQIKKCSHHLGMAFQIADDILDYGKSALNIAAAVGLDVAGKLFEEELLGFTEELKSLGLWNKSFQSVVSFLKNYSKQPASL